MIRIRSSRTADEKPAGIPGKIGLSLFLSVFALFGLVFIGFIGYEFVRIVRTHFWDRVECRILSSGVKEVADDSSRYHFEVEYTYIHPVGNEGVESSGKTYTGTVYQGGAGGESDYAKVGRLVDRYPAGGRATCRVNPEKPDEAVLEPRSLWFGLIALFPLIFVLIGVGGIVGVWRSGRKRPLGPDGQPKPEPISEKARPSKSMWILVVFFGVFFAVGAGTFWPFFMRPIQRVQVAKDWPAVPCRIISSRVESHRGDDSTTYSVDILFTYRFNSREYRSNRYKFMDGSSSGYEGKQAIVSANPPGSQQTCYVNPGDPTEAVLERGYTVDMLVGLVPLLFAAIGAGGLIFGVRRILRGDPPKRPTFAGPESELAPGGTGPVVLKPRGGSPWGKLFGVILAAAFWNGIVSVFVYQAAAGWRRGSPEWFLTLFLVPFVLIGLALIGGIVYQFLALFNPRPRLRLDRHPLMLGDSCELGWELSGQVSRISRFEIFLEGREEATYRRGTSTSTDKAVFVTLPVMQTEDRRLMAVGRTTLNVPADTVHSFNAPNNKIVWIIRLRGDIARWPDVAEEFEVAVRPPTGSREGRA